MRTRWKSTIAAATLAVLAAGAIAAYQYRPLSVAIVQTERNIPIQVFGLGTVEARVLSKIGFKVTGTITELHADHGDQIRVGQILARLESSEQQARVAKARAQVQSAEASVRVAEAAAHKAAAIATQRTQISERRQSLLARNAVSQEAAEEAQLNAGVAKADLLVSQSEIVSAKAKLDDARAQYDYERVILAQHELLAPFDGVVIARTKELGTVVPAGESLFTLIEPESVWLLAYLDESRAGGVRLGQRAEVRLRSLPNQIFEGTIARIGIESDRVNEERRVYVSCTRCPEDFFIGEQAEVIVTTGVLPEALMIPEAMIDDFDGMSGTIWTIEDGRLNRRRVTLGSRSLDGRLEIAAGLPEGAAVPLAAAPGFRTGRWARASAGAPR